MGRPPGRPLIAGARRDVVININLTRNEADRVKEKAGDVPVAAFMRNAVLARVDEEDEEK